MATSKAGQRPKSVTLRPYNVGFGDCFLLSFHYPGARSRHVLIDFGSNRLPKNASRGHMLKIANAIKRDCGGKLDVLVATHRHKDHISGFATNKKGTAPGNVIASCKPSVVIQPWTEDPKLPADAVSPEAASHHQFQAALAQMQQFAAGVAEEMPRRAFGWSTSLIAKARNNDDGAKNASARNNLNQMASRSTLYVKRGDKLNLKEQLPGVRVTVLGPPTLKDGSLTYASTSSEYWLSVRNAWTTQRYSRPSSYSAASIPIEARWFVNAAKRVHLEETQQLVRLVDSFLNNTSVILLFEAAGKKLLFPGDAQLENWRGALDDEKMSKLLSDVDVYKVGHHGSRNATPRRLWDKFQRRSKDAVDGRLRTVMSTMTGVYEDTNEVPRKTLVAALKEFSNLYDTEKIKDISDPDPLTL
jgi:hypothetical protein